MSKNMWCHVWNPALFIHKFMYVWLPSQLLRLSEHVESTRGQMQAGWGLLFREPNKLSSPDSNKWTSLLPHSSHLSASDKAATHRLLLSVLKCRVVFQTAAFLTFTIIAHWSESKIEATQWFSCHVGVFHPKRQKKKCVQDKIFVFRDLQRKWQFRKAFLAFCVLRFHNSLISCVADQALGFGWMNTTSLDCGSQDLPSWPKSSSSCHDQG